MFIESRPIVVGMVHLLALPGAPGFGGDLSEVERLAVADARALAEGGVDALAVENFGDSPFLASRVGAHTVAAMAVIARAIREAAPLPLGINVLRNDPLSALAVARAVGASFIRVNVHVGARLTDQGIIQGEAAETMRYRQAIGADGIAVWADLDVKHSQPLAPRDPVLEVEELVHRGRADAVIVTGATTGRAPDPAKLAPLREACKVPLVVGSGMTVDTVEAFCRVADGFIVGTAFKRDGLVAAPVDAARVRRFVERVREG